jgi:hypothetical protein
MRPSARHVVQYSLSWAGTVTHCAVLLACSGDAERPPMLDTAGAIENARPQATLVQSCEAHTAIECKIDLGHRNGIQSCFVGVRVCINGDFSDCVSADAAEMLLEEFAEA